MDVPILTPYQPIEATSNLNSALRRSTCNLDTAELPLHRLFLTAVFSELNLNFAA